MISLNFWLIFVYDEFYEVILLIEFWSYYNQEKNSS